MDDRSLQVRGCSVRKFTGIVALWFAVILVGTDALAADFTESFEDQDFIDLTNLTANLSVEEQAVYLAWSNSQQHRLPDSITPGTAIGSDSETDLTFSVVLGDVDGDGHLDLVAGNNGTNKLYLNDGSGGFTAGTGTAIGDETDGTLSVVLGDVDGDGDLDLVAGNYNQTNKLVKTIAYNTNAGNIYSTKVNDTQTGITGITLTAGGSTVTPPNTSIDYFVSNTAGTTWYKATPGVVLSFPDTGNDDVRWRATLKSLSPVRSPMIGQVTLTYTLTLSAAAILKVSTAAANNDASSVTIEDLDAITGLSNQNTDNFAAYQAAIVAANGGDLNTLTEIQEMVDAVNTVATDAITAIDAVTTDASSITVVTLTATGVSGVLADNLTAYQAAIVAAADGDLNTLAKIQGMVDAVNVLVEIGIEADNGITGYSFVEKEFTIILVLNNVVSLNIGAYNSYIDANADLFSAIATSAEVQSMVHIVNVIAAAAEPSSLTSQHLVLAGVVVNAGTDPVNTLSVAELAQVSFDINAANPVTTAALQGIAEQVVTPVISLTGNATVTIEAGGNYTEQGAIASDAHDVDTSPTVTVGGDSVDASSVGSYTVTYNVTDASGNVASQVTRTVTVVDTTAPVLTMIAGTDTVERGGAWTDAGATTTEGTITTSGTVDTDVVGTYTITYSATDASDLTTTATRTVTVTADITIPVISLRGDASVSLELGDSYSDAGATAVDNVDGTITSSIETVNRVDVNTAGTYTITYNVADAAGNAATEVTRTVVVEPIPIILVIPEDRVVNAVGYLTGVNLDPQGIASATDGDGTAIDIVADQTGPFQSGNHEIEWSATSAGRTVSATQRLKIHPLVNLATAIRTTEGDSFDIEVLLSGQAADYPLTVPFIISGTAVEGDGDGGDYTVIIAEGAGLAEGDVTATIFSLSITADDVAESEESVVITLGEPTNAALGLNREQVITILEENLPPQVTLQVSQAGVVGSSIAQDGGTAMINPEVDDVNATDTYTVDWANALLTLPEASVVIVDGEGQGAGFPYEVLEFDPADLTTGVYLVAVDVSDGVNSVSAAVSINILAQAPVLSEATDSDGDGISDADEGAGDSDADGIPDYVDNINVVYVANTLASSAGVVQSEPGTTLMLGGIALGLGKNNVMVTESEIAATENVAEDQGYDYIADLIDFAVTGAEFGHSYTLVVPLSVVLPEGAVYRKYSTLGGWANFVENATNALSSAMTVEGVCPELGSDAYTLGLTAGDDCLQLLIEDGGPNDADGIANGTLVDPGGIAIKYIGTPSDSSEITLSSAQLTANGSASATVTVTVLDAQGVGLEHMSVSASVAISGAGVGIFVEQGSGVYTATLTAGNTAGSAAVVAVIDNGEVSVTVSSDPITLNAVAVVTPPSSGGGGGCTVATDGSADASLLLLLIMAVLLLARRRYQFN